MTKITIRWIRKRTSCYVLHRPSCALCSLARHVQVKTWSGVLKFIARFYTLAVAEKATIIHKSTKSLETGREEVKVGYIAITLVAPVSVIYEPGPSIALTVANALELSKAQSVFWEVQRVTMDTVRVPVESRDCKAISCLFCCLWMLSWGHDAVLVDAISSRTSFLYVATREIWRQEIKCLYQSWPHCKMLYSYLVSVFAQRSLLIPFSCKMGGKLTGKRK